MPGIVIRVKTAEGWQSQCAIAATPGCAYHYVWEIAVVSEL